MKSSIMNYLMNIEIDLINDYEQLLEKHLIASGINYNKNDIINAYFNTEKKLIDSVPRKIYKSKEFVCPKGYEQKLQEIEKKIIFGKNLVPFMSKNILKGNYDDLLLNDWNIYHFHLSDKMDKNEFVRRSDYELFAYFTLDSCYFIQIYPHKKKSLYSTQEMVRILYNNWPELIEKHHIIGLSGLAEKLNDSDYETLRRAKVSTFVEIAPDNVFWGIGGGYTSSGLSQEVLHKKDNYLRFLSNAQNTITNNHLIIKNTIKNMCTSHCDHYKYKLLFFSKDELTVAEKNNRKIIQIFFSQSKLRICEPQELFGFTSIKLSSDKLLFCSV